MCCPVWVILKEIPWTICVSICLFVKSFIHFHKSCGIFWQFDRLTRWELWKMWLFRSVKKPFIHIWGCLWFYFSEIDYEWFITKVQDWLFKSRNIWWLLCPLVPPKKRTTWIPEARKVFNGSPNINGCRYLCYANIHTLSYLCIQNAGKLSRGTMHFPRRPCNWGLRCSQCRNCEFSRSRCWVATYQSRCMLVNQ